MLTHEDLFSLEKYARVRPEFRAKVIAHKKNRQLPIGAHATLYFEDALSQQITTASGGGQVGRGVSVVAVMAASAA